MTTESQHSDNVITVFDKYVNNPIRTTVRHNRSPDFPVLPSLASLTVSRNTSKRPTRSVGPAMCSGWNWTLKMRKEINHQLNRTLKKVTPLMLYLCKRDTNDKWRPTWRVVCGCERCPHWFYHWRWWRAHPSLLEEFWDPQQTHDSERWWNSDLFLYVCRVGYGHDYHTWNTQGPMKL